MAKLLKLRRGTDTQHSTFTGAEGEVTVNTTNDSLHVHDGATAGGTELAKADLSNVDGSLSNNLGFADNVLARFGTSNDLDIVHNGTNSVINNYTGKLILENYSDDKDIELKTDNGGGSTTTYVLCDGSSGAVNLNHYGSNKLATTSTGINVTGTVTCDGLTSSGNLSVVVETGSGITVKDTSSIGVNATTYIEGRSGDNTQLWYVGDVNASGNVYLSNNQNGNLYFRTNNTDRAYFSSSGSFEPGSNNQYDIGSNGNQWRNAYFDGTVNCDGLSADGNVTLQNTTGVVVIKDSNTNGSTAQNYISARTGDDTEQWYIGQTSSSSATLEQMNKQNASLKFGTNNTWRAQVQSDGHFSPWSNNTYDLGTSSLRWRNVYTNDLNLSNEGGTNDVDGTWGSWTIQEGEDDLFLLNRRNGKKYKFNLSEVN